MRGHTLKVLAYFDEIEVCNPLGSHNKVHKLGKGFFIMLCVAFCCQTFKVVFIITVGVLYFTLANV